MNPPLHHPNEPSSNPARVGLTRTEPRSLRTYTPTLAILARSAGIYHWTPEGRRLYDFTSGVLVANLGHNPESWMKRFTTHMGWPNWHRTTNIEQRTEKEYFSALPLSAYNAVTLVEIEASRRLIEL